ncbi:MAG: SIR2 family protein [Arcobacteraceae bacterium]|jgi:hypothetical protein|nr:SIR2 family protein [Bacteroidales bacterium]MDY0364507.1 SIR2 family protein [Arcobacteraceae bacterium]
MNKKQYNSLLKESIQSIQNALDTKNLTIFAGSGVSADSNLPLWSDLISDIKKSLKTEEKDYLKVAELFYLQFKENKYYEKITEYFPQSSFPNLLHKTIVNLEVKNLITTNWDELFEKAIYENGKFFDIIKDEEDIGYTTGFSKLVKMHGSLDTKNIVFKESDYLNYSSNFPLIENYVKSVFSTDTVLLVGYSLNDINVKQIISWVNFQSKNIKPIYFLKVDAEFDYLEFEYYKNKNIFVLYWNNEKLFDDGCCGNDKHTLEQSGKMIYSFLEKISVKNIDINNLSFKEIVENLHKELSILDSYEYVMPQTIVNIIKRKFNLYGINEIYYENDSIVIQTKKLCKLFEFIKKTNNNQIDNYIYTLMNKTNTKFIRCMTTNTNVFISEVENKNFENYLYDFSFDELKKELQQISFCASMDGNEKLFLKKAYLLYQNRDFRESYEVLKEVSKVSFQNRKFDIWFIAEFNKKYFCNLMRSDKEYINDKAYMNQVECYCKEIGKIDLQSYINKLPLKYQEILQPLYDFKSFIDRKLISSIYLVDSLNKDLDIWNNGGFSYNQNISNVIQIWEELEFFINSYDLTVEYDGKIKEIYQNIFKSVIINKIINKDFSIVPFVVSMGIRSFYDYKDLNKFLNKFKKDRFDLVDENKDLIKTIDNIVLKVKDEKNVFCFYCQYWHKLLTFLSFMSISNEVFNHIIDKFNELLDSNDLTIVEYEVMNIFIVNQYYKNKNNIDVKGLEKTIKEYLRFFINGKFGIYAIESLRHTDMFSNIFKVLMSIDSDYKFNDTNIVEDFIYNIKKYDVNIQNLFISSFLDNLAKVSTSEIEQIIIEYKKGVEDGTTK